ncbi:MAG: hypothetical protein HC905_15925 [Bacteroidales bacterium]|nr:hypothetical protein [Bacteroidales bacterium]
MYNWQTANSVCLSGWHLPSDNEWKQLEIAAGLSSANADESGWRGSNQAISLFENGSLGFDILFGGQKYDYGSFTDVGTIGAFWTSTDDNTDAWYRGFHVSHGDIHRESYSKVFGYSVRCVKNSVGTVILDSIANVSEFAGKGYARATSTGGANITERGICWGTSPNPTTTGSKASSGTGTGSYTIDLTGLNSYTTYYARAYVVNAEGTAYSNEISFTTDAAFPPITTTVVSSITSSSASSGGNITNTPGITILARGVCWSKNPNPTISNNKTTDGTGSGTFTSSITGLSSNTTYYVRAYVTVNGGTAYGNERTFKTTNQFATSTVTDPRNGKTYNTIQIQNRWWMAQNLSYNRPESWFYNNDSAGFSTYGRMYTWQQALTACPSGWHVASDNEWKELELALGMDAGVVDNEGWRGTDQGYQMFADSSSGFEVLFGGQRYSSGNFQDVTTIGTYWTSTESGPDNAWYRGFNSARGDIHREDYSKLNGYYVRCTQNKIPELTTKAATSITDSSVFTGGIITTDGGAAITTRGVCWGTSHNPVVSADTTKNGTGTGEFTSFVDNLTPGVTYYIRAYATNSVGTGYGNEITITTNTTIPEITTVAISSITDSSAVSGGTIISNGGQPILAKGVCWRISSNPTTANDTTLNGTGSASFASTLKNLLPNQNYYVRAYARNSNGTAYGNEVMFQTNKGLPKVTTSAITSITDSSANGGGNITSNGGDPVIARGLCWSTSQNPTISNDSTLNGSGSGAFTGKLEDLAPNTTYYVRAYARNSVGVGYGNQVSFSTAVGYLL